MAQYVIPPKTAIVKCHSCKTLYVPDRRQDRHWAGGAREFASFEKCPVCGYDDNRYRDTIPLWRYNLIKMLRGGFRHEQTDDSGTDD